MYDNHSNLEADVIQTQAHFINWIKTVPYKNYIPNRRMINQKKTSLTNCSKPVEIALTFNQTHTIILLSYIHHIETVIKD